MDSLIKLVENLKKSPVKEIVGQRMGDFEELGKKESKDLFKELCFCLLTANFTAHGGIKIQNEIGEGFFHLSEEDLAKKLSELGHRFPNMRARFIIEAREHKDSLKETLDSFSEEKEARLWLAKNIKGLGMKESSHFLRNIGYKNIAIIDLHILNILVSQGVVERPKTLTLKKYIEIEQILEELADKTQLTLGELDLYLWYNQTGKVLK